MAIGNCGTTLSSRRVTTAVRLLNNDLKLLTTKLATPVFLMSATYTLIPSHIVQPDKYPGYPAQCNILAPIIFLPCKTSWNLRTAKDATTHKWNTYFQVLQRVIAPYD